MAKLAEQGIKWNPKKFDNRKNKESISLASNVPGFIWGG